MGSPPLIPLACPRCRTPLDALRCPGCGAAYREEDGIPELLPPGDDEHKSAQAAFFDDEADPEWETVRPFAAPAHYRWLMEEKLRRATDAIGPLAGETVLVVCGGSGMDAHLLANAGARVVTCDLSVGAARRARERARRFGLDVVSIVADVERLPFADRAAPVVLVHDGLHHLERPEVGLAEMARVAGRAVSVTEPARAAATSAAVRVGLAQEREEAGNRVARLRPGDVTAPLEAAGFRVVAARRYPMRYRHEPGAVVSALSSPPLRPFGRVAQRALDVTLARFGNKLAVQAVRR